MSESTKKYGKYGIVMTFLMLAVFFVGNYAMYQLSPLAPELMELYSLDNSQFASIFSAAMIPGVVLSLISGILCDRYGVNRVIGISVVLATIAVVARVFAHSYVPLFITMIFAGVACTFGNSNVGKFLGPWFPEEKLSSWIGVSMAGGTLASIVGVATTAYFPSLKSAFIFAAVIAVIVMILWFVLVKEPDEVSAADNEQTADNFVEGLKVSLTNKNIWIAGLALLCLFLPMVVISGFMPRALETAQGLGIETASIMTSTVLVGSLFGTIIGPMICDKMGRDKLFLIIVAIINALGTFFSWQIPSIPLMAIVMFVTGFSIASVIPVIMSMPYKIVGPKYAGTAGGLISTLMTLGPVVIPPYILTKIAGDNNELVLMMTAGIVVIGIVFLLFLPSFKKEGAK